MTFKEIAVYVDSLPECETRIRAAADLAHRHAAHLVGVYVAPALLGYTPHDCWALGDGLVEVIERAKAVETEAAAAARHRFADLTAALEPAAEWREMPQGGSDHELIQSARYSDLAIVGQRDEEGDRSRWLPLLLSSGSPTLVLPERWRARTFGARPIIAWNASREAHRAVREALPLLVRAQAVTIVIVDPHVGDSGHGEEPGADVARYLARHGIQATVKQVAAANVDPAAVILECAAETDADLIVMGAYGHSRFTEFVLGGVTRTMLRRMPMPVLMAN